MYWDDLEVHDGGERIEEIWLNHPLVRAEANRRISGHPAVWPTEWFAREFATHLPLRSAAVIGCGTGAFERDLISRDVAAYVHAVDIAGPPIRRATELAVASAMENRVTYVQADAVSWLADRAESFDGVFFHASLHHFQPEAILSVVHRALRPGGLLYFDEYVGPSRTQWNAARLILPNIAYRLLPHALVRPHLIRSPINHEDPTEAVASHRIMPTVRELFDVVAERPYGGNLLPLIYPNLHRPPAVRASTLDRGVRRLIHYERALSRVGLTAYYSVVVARKGDARV